MNILLLSRYGRLGASSRQRFLQYLPYLQARGFSIAVSPLQPDDYVKNPSYGHMSLPTVVRRYFAHLKTILTSAHYDLLWIEKELLPWVPGWIESVLMPARTPFVIDYDDAVFHRYDSHPNPFVRKMYGRKLDKFMRRAALVIVGNDYLAERARNAGAPRIVCLPTVVDIERYRVCPGIKETFTVGWIGSPYTQKYLRLIQPALTQICHKANTRLLLVGTEDGEAVLPGVRTEIRPWSEQTEVSDILDFDVGIMPLPDMPFERGKCGYKLIQYMACGKPVVASPVGVNTQLVENQVNGFFADNESDWISALSTLRDNVTLRLRMGQAGRAMVESHYSLSATAPRLESLLRAAVEKNSHVRI